MTIVTHPQQQHAVWFPKTKTARRKVSGWCVDIYAPTHRSPNKKRHTPTTYYTKIGPAVLGVASCILTASGGSYGRRCRGCWHSSIDSKAIHQRAAAVARGMLSS